MDNMVIWAAVIGVGGTAVGVCLGNWLQSRNIRQQREWMLQDQKREWLRHQRQEEYQRILEYLQGKIEYILDVERVIESGSAERKDELFRTHAQRTASAMPVIFTMMGEDKELADLLLEFDKCGKGISEALSVGDSSRLSDIGRQSSGFAGKIRRRLNKLLEETFD